MQESVNNPQAKTEIYLERSGAGDGRSQHRNYGGAPPWISTVQLGAGAEPEQEHRAAAEHRSPAPDGAGAQHHSPAPQPSSPATGAQRLEPGLNPGEGVPEPEAGGPNRGWDSALTEAVTKITSPLGYRKPTPKVKKQSTDPCSDMAWTRAFVL